MSHPWKGRSLVFTTAISRIWLVGLVLFALTPVLIAARPQPSDTQTDTQTIEVQATTPETAPKAEATGQPVADKRDPASEEAPLATGN